MLVFGWRGKGTHHAAKHQLSVRTKSPTHFVKTRLQGFKCHHVTLASNFKYSTHPTQFTISCLDTRKSAINYLNTRIPAMFHFTRKKALERTWRWRHSPLNNFFRGTVFVFIDRSIDVQKLLFSPFSDQNCVLSNANMNIPWDTLIKSYTYWIDNNFSSVTFPGIFMKKLKDSSTLKES